MCMVLEGKGGTYGRRLAVPGNMVFISFHSFETGSTTDDAFNQSMSFTTSGQIPDRDKNAERGRTR